MRGHNRIPLDRHPLAMVLSAVVIVSVLAAIAVVGPAKVFDFLFSFLLPMAVGFLVVVGVIVLVAREGGKVLDSRDDPPPTNPRAPSGGGELSVVVYWLTLGLFSLASVAMVCFFWLVVRDWWIHERPLVAGRLEEGEALRVLLLLLATVAASSGLLWRHYRRIDSYGSPLEPIFMAAFTLCGALAAVVALPALLFG
jgi:hypothetical protein